MSDTLHGVVESSRLSPAPDLGTLNGALRPERCRASKRTLADDKKPDAKPPLIDARTPRVTIADEKVAFVKVANGALVKGTGFTPVWMVIDGVRHGYTSRAQFDSVHKVDTTIYTLLDVDAIPEGAPFASDLELIKAPGNVPVFLLNNSRNRGFMSREIFNQYQYDDNPRKLHTYTAGVIAAIPEDPPLPGG